MAMTALDGGTNAVPLRVLADICRASGDLVGARRYLELCRDAEGWDPSFSYSPRTSTGIQAALREAAQLPATAVVDLPEILARQLDAGLPDRRVFLDYCHLTAPSIQLAMAETASRVMALLTGQTVPAQALQSKSIAPSDRITGKACFLAAVHNAHYFQDAEIVRYWCDKALQAWPESAELMTRFIECQTRGFALMDCKAGLELLARDELGVTQYLSRGGAPRLDLTLCDAVVAAVGRIGIDIGPAIADLRAREHAIGDDPKDLTAFYFSSAIPGRSERGWTSLSMPNNHGSHRIYASAFWETSRFVFVHDGACDLRLNLTYRVPMPGAAGGAVAIAVNGHRVAELSATTDWSTRQIPVPADCLAQGINAVTITWPVDEQSADLVLGEAAEHLISRRLPAFYRIFGDVHALSAERCRFEETQYQPA